MRNAMLLAAGAAAVLSLGAGAAQAQLIDGQALASSNLTTASRAGLGAHVVPGGHIMPRAGTRAYAEATGQLYAPAPAYVDTRVQAGANAYGYAAPYSAPYDSRYATSYAPGGYYAPQPSYAAGSYVWVDNRGWVWVPQGAYLRADGSLGAAVNGDFRSNLGGRVGGSIR